MTRNSFIRFFVCLTLIPLGADAQTFGPNSPSSGSQSGSNSSWTNPGNITSSDNAYATNATYGTTNQLIGSNFGFSILNTDMVQGIELGIERKYVPQDAITRIGAWQESGDSSMTYALSSGNNRVLVCILSAENGTTQATYSVNYGGIPLTKATGVSIQSGSGFTATLEMWYLLEANLPANGSHTLAIVPNSFTRTEYFTSIAAAVYSNVDQNNPFESFVTGNSSSSSPATLQLPSAMTCAAGSMSFVAEFCGNNTSPAKTASGQTGCFTINNSFVERVDVYRANTSCCTSSGGGLIVADKAYTTATTDQPTVTFSGTPNRRVIFGISFKRSGVLDNAVYLMKAGSTTGSNYAQTTTVWPLTDTYQYYGGASDLWGTSWDFTHINNSGFGASMVANVLEGTAQVDHYTLTVYTVSTLPVELMNFTWYRTEDFTELQWVTATEMNSSHFEVEKSWDGKAFGFMASVPALGNSQGPQLYTYKDYESVQKQCYYRLKMVDQDGTFEYSDIQFVNRLLTDDVLFPNPADQFIQIPFETAMNKGIVMDAKGNYVRTVDLSHENGPFSLDIQELPNGSYYLLIGYQDPSLDRKMLKFQKMSN